MPDTMKAAVVPQLGQPLEVQEAPVPEPGPFDALVRVEYTGVCHTDLHAAKGDWPVKPTAPFIPGHEGVGTVTAVGDQVDRVQVGDKVGNAWLASACGSCEYCQTGWETLCPNQQNSGYSVDGSFGQYMLVDSRYCAMIPGGVDMAAAAPVLCAGVTVYKGLKVTDTKPGEWVLISGIGGLGHLAVQDAVAMGLRVAAIDIDDSKLDLAREHGAEVTVNAQTSDDATAELIEATGGVHAALVTAANAHAFPLDIFTTVLFGLTVRGSIVGTRKDMTEALDFFARGKVSTTYATRPMEDINDIFAEMEAGQIDGRIVMDMAL